MPVPVVDCLKSSMSTYSTSQPLGVRVRRLNRTLQAVIEQSAIRQPGQTIMVRLKANSSQYPPVIHGNLSQPLRYAKHPLPRFQADRFRIEQQNGSR